LLISFCKPHRRAGHSPLHPNAVWFRFARGTVKPPLLVGEVAARKRGRWGAESLRFLPKMRKPPTPLRRLLRRRHLPCTAGEACTLRRTKPEEQKLLGFSTYRSLQTSP